MSGKLTKDRRAFEVMVIVVTLGMTGVFYHLGGYKMVALNLFFLPVILTGYYLGRTSAGVLAVFCALSVTIAATLDGTGFAAHQSAVTVGLSLTVWAAVLGLAAILVGTLCDERARTVDELHEAYVGVVEVLSKYLQGANPRVKARSVRIAELSQMVAQELKLSQKETDDIRVGALLHDLGTIEITTQLISKAMGVLESDASQAQKHTFHGMDLVHSLGTVLRGALPLLVAQDDAARECWTKDREATVRDIPLGAQIIRAVRAYDTTIVDSSNGGSSPDSVLAELRRDSSGDYDPEILDALERVAKRPARAAALEPVHA
jgi:hypothetical protein